MNSHTWIAMHDPPLHKSRIGTVLVSAAVIDDVIGLVLSSLIPALSALNSANSKSNLAWTVIRPILSSVLMATLTPLVARIVLRPIFRCRQWGLRWCSRGRPGQPWGSLTLLRLLSLRRNTSHSSQWGTQHHADRVGVTLMILIVSAFSTISFCK
jgi:hypothetical protein